MRLALGFGVALAATAAGAQAPAEPRYALAVASFAPVDSDVFVADADGSHAAPFLPSPALDYSASFSRDGRWIVFTSTRGGDADVYRARVDGSQLEQLTRDPAFDDQGALSPDGKALAFVSSRGGTADVWTLDLASGALRNLTNAPGGDFRPAWSPDGRWIAFSSDRDSLNPKFTFATVHSTELYVMRADGSEQRRLTRRNAYAGSPVWLPDGRELVYYQAAVDEVQKIRSPLRLRATTQLATIDVATGAGVELTSGPGEKWSPHALAGDRVAFVSGGPDGGVEFLRPARAGARGEFRSPSWSPDGARMVFNRDVESEQWPPVRAWPSGDARFRLVRAGVFTTASPTGALVMSDQKAASLHNSVLLVDAAGAARRTVFGDPDRNALAPAFSPRGDRIAFGVGRFFQNVQGVAPADIAVLTVDGADVQVLTDGAANYGFPDWSPDGKQVVYRLASAERNGLFIVDVATRAVRTLVDGKAHVNFPKWSPKGDRIAFTADIDGDYELYTLKPDGTDLKRVTRAPGNDAHNAWSPDGEWIAFTSARGGFKDESALYPYNPQPYGDIYVVRPDGSDVTMLTNDQFEDGTPSFIPPPR
ncbi:MAG TPA: hypothetical protein VE907_14100 [Gammaproteobacteria bacterium]|nr:hypothetical protein [Gammaproteobacteria bacterium]